MGRVLYHAGRHTPVKNLNISEYMHFFLDGKENHEELFAELESTRCADGIETKPGCRSNSSGISSADKEKDASGKNESTGHVKHKSASSVLFKAELWNRINHDPVNERQRQIINSMLDNSTGHMTTSKYAKCTKCSSDTALRDMRDLTAREKQFKNQDSQDVISTLTFCCLSSCV